jgi:hypothetical protein
VDKWVDRTFVSEVLPLSTWPSTPILMLRARCDDDEDADDDDDDDGDDADAVDEDAVDVDDATAAAATAPSDASAISSLVFFLSLSLCLFKRFIRTVRKRDKNQRWG